MITITFSNQETELLWKTVQQTQYPGEMAELVVSIKQKISAAAQNPQEEVKPVVEDGTEIMEEGEEDKVEEKDSK